MLRKRSRPVGNNHDVASSDNTALLPPNAPSSKPTSPSLFLSPRRFMAFSPKGSAPGPDTPTMSPTSILEPRPFSPIASPFFFERSPRWSPSSPAASCPSEPQAIGLGLAAEVDEGSKPESRKVLFGSELKIQIPPPPPARSGSISPCGPVESPRGHHPIEFGVKNKSSQLALRSPPLQRPPVGSASMDAEMELSEDYTRVISRGPNPRTTHIFDDCCMVECCGGGRSPLKQESGIAMDDESGSAPRGFLSFCHACEKSLGQGKDIFMYRGEKAFCSSECRYQEMLFEEEG